MLPLLYPRLLPLHRALAETAPGGPLPRPLGGLTAERLEEDGIYLLENGCEALLRCEPGVPPALLQALFGARPCAPKLLRCEPGVPPALLQALFGVHSWGVRPVRRSGFGRGRWAARRVSCSGPARCVPLRLAALRCCM